MSVLNLLFSVLVVGVNAFSALVIAVLADYIKSYLVVSVHLK